MGESVTAVTAGSRHLCWAFPKRPCAKLGAHRHIAKSTSTAFAPAQSKVRAGAVDRSADHMGLWGVLLDIVKTAERMRRGACPVPAALNAR